MRLARAGYSLLLTAVIAMACWRAAPQRLRPVADPSAVVVQMLNYTRYYLTVFIVVGSDTTVIGIAPPHDASVFSVRGESMGTTTSFKVGASSFDGQQRVSPEVTRTLGRTEFITTQAGTPPPEPGVRT